MKLHKDRHRTSINFHFLHSVWALNATLIKKNFHFAFHMSLSLCISNVFWPWKRKNLNKHFGSSIAFTGSFLFILLGVMSPRPCYWPYWTVWCRSRANWRTSFGSVAMTFGDQFSILHRNVWTLLRWTAVLRHWRWPLASHRCGRHGWALPWFLLWLPLFPNLLRMANHWTDQSSQGIVFRRTSPDPCGELGMGRWWCHVVS